ncbi:MAG: 7-carboxy-7-deazaguanine synthase QueE [Bacteroidetes bacterium]|nr:7-carboxy-7-deazaguanine synthase QueE [Bacteroidota bacterium]
MEYLFPVSEIFESIQGEGNRAGMRSLFIRFQFCNLTCSWCDTKYTWFKDTGYFKWYSVSELKDIIRQKGFKEVIFTGGEPALFSLDKLVQTGFNYHVETNGTAIPTLPLEIQLSDGTLIKREAMNKNTIEKFNWVVSPKLSNSRQKIDVDSLNYWAAQDFCIFKYICNNDDDLAEVEKIVNDFKIDKNKIYIGLEGVTLKSQLKPEMVDKIVAKGFNFSPRIHVLLWGATRRK